MFNTEGAYLCTANQAQPPQAAGSAQDAGQVREGFEEGQCGAAKLRYYTMRPDVQNARMDAWYHYTHHGIHEGTPWIGTPCAKVTAGPQNCQDAKMMYYKIRPDLGPNGEKMEAWYHYNQHGVHEGTPWYGPGC
jgi:hypothetical protein